LAVVDPDLRNSDWASDGSDFPTWHCNKDTANDGSSVAVGVVVVAVVAAGIAVGVAGPVVSWLHFAAIVATSVVVVVAAGGEATAAGHPFAGTDFVVVVVVAEGGTGQPDCTISAAKRRE
jgi:hypothetical protein